jgi:hypothetical protein
MVTLAFSAAADMGALSFRAQAAKRIINETDNKGIGRINLSIFMAAYW